MMKNAQANPSWWNDKHASAWDRVKDAFARDWDQTKHDFSKKSGRELDQNVGDTVKQAAGKEPIPAKSMPNAKPTKDKGKDKDKVQGMDAATVDYGDIEPALRYGYGASSQYASYKDWDPKLEAQLRGDWDNLEHERSWDEVKQHVRSGWNRARSQS